MAPKRKPMTSALTKAYERYLKVVLAMPGAEAATSYGTPSVKLWDPLRQGPRQDNESAELPRPPAISARNFGRS
jgi:hypothetical protein